MPNWSLHGGAAFDIAVTVGMRMECLAGTAEDGGSPALRYEARKCSHLDTEASCRAAGLTFVPVVAEACGGGWAPAAIAAFRSIAARQAAGRDSELEEVHAHLLQLLGVLLQRENARAVLRRMSGPPGL